MNKTLSLFSLENESSYLYFIANKRNTLHSYLFDNLNFIFYDSILFSSRMLIQKWATKNGYIRDSPPESYPQPHQRVPLATLNYKMNSPKRMKELMKTWTLQYWTNRIRQTGSRNTISWRKLKRLWKAGFPIDIKRIWNCNIFPSHTRRALWNHTPLWGSQLQIQGCPLHHQVRAVEKVCILLKIPSVWTV